MRLKFLLAAGLLAGVGGAPGHAADGGDAVATVPAISSLPADKAVFVAPPARDPSELEVLFWDDATRAARFRSMEEWFAGYEVAPSGKPRALPQGEPLGAALDAELHALMEQTQVAGVMVLQDGKKRFEAYGLGFGPDQRWTSFSVAKSFTSTLLGAAIADGHIASMQDMVTDYIPEMTGSAYDGVTVEQLAQMTSGVRWNENYADPASDVAQMNRFVTEYGPDAIVAQMKALEREAPAGEKWVYKTGETNLLGLLVEKAVGMPLAAYASRHIVDAAGFEGGMFWMVDPRGGNIGGCCLSLRLADYARMGQFALEGGEGQVPAGWFDASVTPAKPMAGEAEVSYGYQWWIYPTLGGWGAQGIFGQSITVLPEQRMVVTVLSNWPTATNSEYRAKWRAMAARLVGEE